MLAPILPLNPKSRASIKGNSGSRKTYWRPSIYVHTPVPGARTYGWNLGKKSFYSRLPITRTLANSNLALTRTKILHWFTIILSSVTRTLDHGSNLPLIRRNFCFDPSDHFYINLTSITRTMSKRLTSRKKCIAVRNIEIILTTMYSFSLLFLFPV